MRAPLAKLLPILQAETARAIETAAAEIAPEQVRAKITAAAKAGQSALRVRLPSPVNVRDTEAAKALTAWCKKEGLKLAWENRAVDLDDGRRVIVWEPEISWSVL
ncbi:hypothetical protein GJ689_21575 [Rhodoplanes serenus]|uniref:Uncharacterized protein n=1 Tax=Rhodoplanes serenus TaxID=200615 RepID=A0A327KCM4_9BRAD|nr:hypothetical protein [Rhodoplanes serenus]MTW18795.1 hypothetical protein [Rhodoplanes serenus]RAI35881.1 hypothetical protein CH340_04615 [Rhodoplanes serenus]